MEKLGFVGMRSLDQFKALSASSISRSSKAVPVNLRSSLDSNSSGSFANLKITAEKLVKEQASVKSDLDMANLKLKKSTDHLRILEEKLQNALNENAKHKVKQKEDEKLWKGLDSKFSSTKTLCDQLTETLQHLASRVQDAEKDKEFFEDKLVASSNSLETLQVHMNDLSSKLESAEKTIINRENELKELRAAKEEVETSYKDEQFSLATLINEKDAEIRQFEAAVAANKLNVESLNSKLEGLHLDLRLKEDSIQLLRSSHECLQKEKTDLQAYNDDFVNKLAKASEEIKELEDLVHALAASIVQLDKQSLFISDKVLQLQDACDGVIHLLKQERDLATKHAEERYNELHNKFLQNLSEKGALHLLNINLNSKVSELQKVQEFVMVQHAEDCRLAEERIQNLEHELEALVNKKVEMEEVLCKLEEKNECLSESLKLSENKTQDLLQEVSTLEAQNKETMEKLQAEIQSKYDEIDILQKAIGKHEQHVDSMEGQISQLDKMMEEKHRLIQQHKDGEERLEIQKTELQALLVAAESKVAEDKKQYDLMLENKQLELSRHMKEISQRNDQAINDIRKKYEVEKLEIINLEKEKAEKLVKEAELKCEQKLVDCREESSLHLIHIQEEHGALVARIHQEHDRKEHALKVGYDDELRRVQLQAEHELREKTLQLRNEHEIQIKALKHQHEDECSKLQEELHVQKSKEERQRALLQLQWKVMGDKPQEDQEMSSKKKYSILSSKIRNSDGNRGQHALLLKEQEGNSPLVRGSQTPVSNLLKKVDEVNTGSAMNIPKHRRKVTHQEYEVETSNGKTITKRRKTKSTVMYADPGKPKRMRTPKVKTPRNVVKETKGGDPLRPSNIGDLFSEGSLNPYADDPYAFD